MDPHEARTQVDMAMQRCLAILGVAAALDVGRPPALLRSVHRIRHPCLQCVAEMDAQAVAASEEVATVDPWFQGAVDAASGDPEPLSEELRATAAMALSGLEFPQVRLAATFPGPSAQ